MALVIISLCMVLIAGFAQTVTWLTLGMFARALFMFAFLICYPADLLWIYFTRETYLTATTFAPYPGDEALATSALIVTVCWFTASVLLLPKVPARTDGPAFTAQPCQRPFRFWLYVVLSALLSSVILVKVLDNGIERTLALRQAVFGEDPLALVSYYALPPLIVYGAAAFRDLTPWRRLVLVIFTLVSLIAVFFTGSRSGLVLSCLLPIGLLVWRFVSMRRNGVGKDLSRLTLIGSAAAMSIFFGAVYISEFRGVTTTETFFRSTDLSQGDVLISLVSIQPAPLQWGQTYLAGITTLIPRSLWPSKPFPGNVVSSLTLTPDRYRLTGAETTAGLLGEAYLNFGWAGAMLAACVFVSLIVACERLLRITRPDALWVLGVLILLRGVNILRGDLANVAAPTIIAIGVWLLVFRRAKTTLPRHEAPPVTGSRSHASPLRSAWALSHASREHSDPSPIHPFHRRHFSAIRGVQ